MLYFDYNCSGFNDWLDDWDGGLTANCDNPRLYHFNFHDVLIDALPPSVADLASPFEGIGELNVAVWQSWWLAIIGCWLMLLLLLPFTFRGRHRINGITFFLALVIISLPFISLWSLLLSRRPTQGMTISIWGSYVSIYCDPNLRRLVTSGWSSMSQAFVFVYCLTVFPLVTVFLLCLMEWKLQRWTHPSDRITINSRPAGASSFSLYPPIDYETEPEILLRPMGGAAFDFQSQQAGVAQNSIRLDVWARARIRDNGFGAGIFEGRDYRIFPRARDGNQGQTTQGQTTQGQTT